MPKSATQHLQISWLTEPKEASIERFPGWPDSDRIDYPLPTNAGRGWMDRLELAAGITLVHAVHQFDSRLRGASVPIGEFQAQYPETSFCVQTTEGGAVWHEEYVPRASLQYGRGFDLFRLADAHRINVSVEGAANVRMTAVFFTVSALHRLIDPGVADRLFSRMGLIRAPSVLTNDVPGHISSVLRNAMCTDVRGKLLRLFAQAKALEYLCKLVHHVDRVDVNASDRSWLATPVIDKNGLLQALHDELLNLEGEVPSLAALAQRYGVSARRLNALFSSRYGQSISTFVMDHRLRSAHLALTTTDVPMKQLAARLGYSHFNNFALAFRKKFGVPPGQLRRRHSDADDDLR